MDDLSEVEAWVRKGQFDVALRQLTSLQEKPIDRRHWAQVASLFRRCGRPIEALRLLSSVVRPSGRLAPSASAAECAEYGVALHLIGADQEASELLSQVNARHYPNAQLYQAFSLFGRWEYDQAVPTLRAYLRNPDLTEYQRLVGEVNLAAALVMIRNAESSTLIRNALERASRLDAKLLEVNLLEISVQDAVFSKNLKAISPALRRAQKILSGHRDIYSLFIRKWEAIASMLSTSPRSSAQLFQSVREDAARLRHFDTIRECDFHQAAHFHDHNVLAHVYFGTPYPSYRNRVIEAGFDPRKWSGYEWRIGRPTKRTHSLRAFKQGQLLHRLMRSLCSDFYAPRRLAQIHADLFPGRFYNPFTSPNVVHQGIRRLRHWLRENHWPVVLQESSSFYRLEGASGIRITIQQEEIDGRTEDLLLAELPEQFSCKQAAQIWGTHPRNALRRLSGAMARGALSSTGEGKNRRYLR